MKKALVIGIDAYPLHPLGGSVNDAVAMASTLERNGDGSPNFSVRLLTSNQAQVTTAALTEAIAELFTGDAETVLFFLQVTALSSPPATPVTWSHKTGARVPGAYRFLNFWHRRIGPIRGSSRP